MFDLSALHQQYRFHTWRVHAWVQHLTPLSAAHFAQDIPGSFGQLHALLVHLSQAERSLFNITTGPQPQPTPPKPEAEADTHAWLAHWAAVADLWLPVLSAQPGAWWDDTVHFRTRSGNELPMRRLDAALQNLDHCAYHTGQVTNALRVLGLEPPKGIGYLPWKFAHDRPA